MSELAFQKYQRLVRIVGLVSFVIVVNGCSTASKKDQDSGPSQPVDWTQVKPVVPRPEPISAYGNPVSYEVYGTTYRVLKSSKNFKQRGVASWYGSKFHGRRTSSGETYDMLKLTAAHKTLPIPCYVKVTNHENGRELIVKVNDRGPFVKERIIDLSYAAAHKLGMTEKGTAQVSIETINFDSYSRPPNTANKRQARSLSQKKSISREKVPALDTRGKNRFVQVGAYSSQKSAQKLAKILDREIDLPVKISSIKRGSKKLYRVRIGPIESLEIATRLANTLNISELGKPSIVYQD